jgi:hypothetical protein
MNGISGRRSFLIGGAAFGVWGAASTRAHAKDPSLGDILDAVVKSQTKGGSLSQADATSGIKEALSFGVVAATSRLGKTDGFFKDGKVHIPLPGTLGKWQKSLAPMGLSAPLDDLDLKMNRAAESSMPAAKKMFLAVVQSISITDAISIVRGGDTGATDFLRSRTEDDLTKSLKPKMKTALNDTGAFGALDYAAKQLRGFGGAELKNNLKGQVIDFAVLKTLDGGFHYVGEEERAIRKDPVKRTTDILRRVFG